MFTCSYLETVSRTPHTIENMICCTNYQIPKNFANISPLPLRKRMPRICWGLAPKFIKHTMMRHFFSFAAWCNGYVRFSPQYDNFGTFTSCSEGNSLQRRKSRTILGRKKNNTFVAIRIATKTKTTMVPSINKSHGVASSSSNCRKNGR